MRFVRAYVVVLKQAFHQEHPFRIWALRPIWKVQDSRSMGQRIRDRIFSSAVFMLAFAMIELGMVLLLPASSFWLKGGLAVAGVALFLLLITLPFYARAALDEMAS